MFIAFEGPDKTGKSTSALEVAHSEDGVFYNARKELHANLQGQYTSEPELPVTYDRIDWLTHMVYRLAMPTREWNDARVRTVFAMPDTHLVFKLHSAEYIRSIKDELYSRGDLVPVNFAYELMADYLRLMNQAQDFKLFKSISVVEVSNDPATGEFKQELVKFAGPAHPWGTGADQPVTTNAALLEMLRNAEQQTL